MPDKIHPDVRIGHVHLKVSDLDRALHFYRDILGFELTAYGSQAAFLSAGGYHHHIGLNTGRVRAARLRRRVLPVYIISRSFIRRGPNLLMRSDGCCKPAFLWKVRPIMA